MKNLRRIREHGAKDERKRILKLIDEMVKKEGYGNWIDAEKLKSIIQRK